MAVPPDSDNPPTESTTPAQPGSDLSLNGETSAADLNAVPDLRLQPEVDSSSTVAPEHVPLERRDDVVAGAPPQSQRPHVDIFFTDEVVDRSLLSRLRLLNPSRAKELLRRSAHDDPADTRTSAAWTGDVKRSWLSRWFSGKAPREEELLGQSPRDELLTAEASSESDPASLAALRDVYATIDQRLARVEAVSPHRDGAIDEALHDLCSQMYARLVRVEAAVQRTEGLVAERPWDRSSAIANQRLEHVEETVRLTHKSLTDAALPEMRANIESQLVDARLALQRTEEAVTDKTLYELCQNIAVRLERAEDTLHRNVSAASESLQEFSARITVRLADVEEGLRRTPQSVASSVLPDVERQLVQASQALQRSDEAMADKTVHELCQNIDARLERTEDRLHRNEGIVAEWLQELSARMTARLAEAEQTIQRIERIVSGYVAQASAQQPSSRMDDHSAHAEKTVRPSERPLGDVAADVIDLRSRAHVTSRSGEPAREGVLARAVLFVSRFVNVKQENGPVRRPWMAELAVPVVVLVAAVAIAALIRTNRGVVPEGAVPFSITEQISTPPELAPNRGSNAPSATAVMANGPRSTESLVSAPQQRPSDRGSAPTTSRRPRFVGTLSITSVPSGASVSINGKPAGKTPLRLPGQRAGSLAVQIAHEGFERWSAAVVVPADRLTEVTARLRATAR